MLTKTSEVVGLVHSFTYLGSEVADTESDQKKRIEKALNTLNKMKPIWESILPDNLKRNFFRALIESVLLYRAWTLKRHLELRLNGTYTSMLRAALNIS